MKVHRKKKRNLCKPHVVRGVMFTHVTIQEESVDSHYRRYTMEIAPRVGGVKPSRLQSVLQYLIVIVSHSISNIIKNSTNNSINSISWLNLGVTIELERHCSLWTFAEVKGWLLLVFYALCSFRVALYSHVHIFSFFVCSIVVMFLLLGPKYWAAVFLNTKV